MERLTRFPAMSMPSPRRSGRPASLGATSSLRWRRSNARSSADRRRSIVGSRATKRDRPAAKRGFDHLQWQGAVAPPATTDSHSATARFTTSGRPRTPTSAAAGCSPPPSSCATHSRHRPCATWHAARLTCTMARSQTLEEVIDLYDRGGIERPSRSVLIRPLGLTDAEESDLIAFHAHTDVRAADGIACRACRARRRLHTASARAAAAFGVRE